MSMLRICSEPGCTTLTLGRLCIDHEPVQSLSRAEVAPSDGRAPAGSYRSPAAPASRLAPPQQAPSQLASA